VCHGEERWFHTTDIPPEDAMTQSLDRAEQVLSDAVVDDREAGVVKAKCRIFTDEDSCCPSSPAVRSSPVCAARASGPTCRRGDRGRMRRPEPVATSARR
jgi:hypothetical protein